MAVKSNYILPLSEKIPTGHIMGSAVPAGTYGSLTAPSGYLFCDGSAVSRTTYSTLFAAIGTTWGSGDGSTTFNVPNLTGRNIVGSATGAAGTSGYVNGSDPNASTWNTHSQTLGATDGSTVHTLSITEMPTHNHGASDSGHTHTATSYNGNGFANPGSFIASETASGTASSMTTLGTGVANITVTSSGSGAAHGNTQPSTVMHVYIKYT